MRFDPCGCGAGFDRRGSDRFAPLAEARAGDGRRPAALRTPSMRIGNRRQMLRAQAWGVLAAGGAAPAPAATIDKVVRVIVGFPAGGGTDITARVLAQALTGRYASSIIVEDKPGASARLAVEYVKRRIFR